MSKKSVFSWQIIEFLNYLLELFECLLEFFFEISKKKAWTRSTETLPFKFETALQISRELSLRSSCYETVPIAILCTSFTIHFRLPSCAWLWYGMHRFSLAPTNDSPLLMDRGTNSFVGGPFFCDYGTSNRLLQRPITYSIMEMKQFG